MPVEQPTNRVLASLAKVGRRSWLAHLERVELLQGHTLLMPNAPIEFLYFPEDALVGLMHAGESTFIEVPVALVGNDGLVGVAPFLGARADRLRAEVLHQGGAWRLPVEALSQVDRSDKEQLRVVLRYLQALNAQMSQAALCRLQHKLCQRLCRWLLDAFDRVPGTVLHIETTGLGAWLGAESGALERATAQLVAEGALVYRADRITLLDRAQLVRLSCGCHERMSHLTEQLLPQVS